MRKKRTWKRFLTFFLCALLIFDALVTPLATYGATATTWSSLPIIDITGNSQYYILSDFSTKGVNQTVNATNMGSVSNYDSLIVNPSPTRVTYDKKFKVSYGMTINLTGTTLDTGSGGSDVSGDAKLYWNVMEWDGSGNWIYDTSWMEITTPYKIGSSIEGGTANSSYSRSSVQYITLIFRYATGDQSTGGVSPNITPAEIAESFLNMFLCYNPFVYTIDNGESTSTINRTGMEILTNLLSSPFRTGYTFSGWKVTSSSTISNNWANNNVYSTEQLNTWMGDGKFYNSFFGNVTFTAQFEPNIYKITLDNQSATTAGTMAYFETYGEGMYKDASCTTKISSITIPTKTGYNFMGYYTEKNGGGTCYIDESGVIKAANTTFVAATTLYAVWSNVSYKVTFDANGGTTTASDRNYSYDDTVDLSPSANKDGYTFIGWSTSSTSRIPLASFSMPASNLTLYAVYTIEVSDVENHDYPDYAATESIADDEVYFLVWIKNTPTNYKVYPLIYKYDVTTMVYKYELPATDVSSFVGSNEYCYQLIAFDNAGNQAVLYDGSGGEPTPVLPKEYPQTVYHYKMDANTGSWELFDTTTEMVKEGTTYTPAYVTEPVGYRAYSKDSGGIVSGAKTYSAFYKAIDYTLTFHANGGNCSTTSKTISYGGYYGELPVPTRTGYVFTGWNTKSDASGRTIASGDIYETVGNGTVYAQWVANVYTITLDNQDAETVGTTAYYEKYGSGNYTSIACTTAISSITTPTKEGYTFKGYYTDKEGMGTCYISAAGVISATKTTFSVNTTLYAYWVANTYRIQYNANGGSGTMADTFATYDESVTLSTNLFERTGYTFKGWSTSAGGSVVYEDKDAVKNLTATNGDFVTLYAVWNINSYTVIYDYWTNGGTSVSASSKEVSFGSDIDLNITANKDGYTFVGWNTNPTATTKLNSLTMSTDSVTLYAVYKKTITVKLTEMSDSGTITTTLSDTIYNNQTHADFLIAEKGNWTGWTNIGWTDQTGATEDAVISTGATCSASDSITLYALYASEVTVSYDTNGSSMGIDGQTKECFYNASGNSFYPTFMLANAPKLPGHSFVEWRAEDGTGYQAGTSVVFKTDNHLTASWDKYPEIEAYDRYFTLEQAKNGEITQAELLKKVVGNDLEDGILENGTDVIVKEYNASTFTDITTDEEVEITYQASDSFGNTITKQITVTVVDTSMKECSKKSYVRFISSQFFTDDTGNLIPFSQGGLEETSIWRTNSNYRNLLQNTFSNSQENTETWIFTLQDIRKMKEYTCNYGPVMHAIEMFYKIFDICKQSG